MANRYWIGSTPGNFSDGQRWSLTSGGAPVGSVPGSGDDVFFDGGGIGQCTVDAVQFGAQFVAKLTRINAHLGGIAINFGPLGIGDVLHMDGDSDFGTDGNVVTGPTARIRCHGTGAIAGTVTGNLSVDGDYIGSLQLRQGDYYLASSASHSGTLRLEQDASIADFSGTVKPGITVQNSGAGSQLPSAFDYPGVSVVGNPGSPGRAVFVGNEIPTVGSIDANAGGTIVSPTAGLIITSVLILNGGAWVKGQGSITFDAANTTLQTVLAAPSFERLEVATGTLTLALIFTGTTAEGLYIRSGASCNLNAQTITLADPADGALFGEAGCSFDVAGLAGSTVNAGVVDLNGTGPGPTLLLNPASVWNIRLTGGVPGSIRFATIKNLNAGTVGVDPPIIATDCLDETPGSCVNVQFVTTPPVIPGTKLYLRTDNSVAPHTVPGAEFNKLLLPILAGTPTNQSMSTGILGNDNSGFGFTVAMNNALWEPGATPIRINCINGDSDVSKRIRISRENSLGVPQQTTGYSNTVTMSTGIKNFTVPTITWTAGATSDVMRVEYEVDDGALAQTIQIGLNNADTYVETPVIMHVSATGTPIQLLMGHAA